MLGFTAGWKLHQSPTTVLLVPPADAIKTTVSTALSAAPISNESRPTREGSETSHSVPPSVTERLATLSWLKEKGLFSYIPFLSHDGISPEFAQLYGLTPQEIDQLSQATRQAKPRLEELTRQRAQLDPASSADKLIVTIPAFPMEGGQIYTDLHTQISSVLGADRYAVFDTLSGDALNNDFEGLGLARYRYEVILEQATGGIPHYKITRSFVYDSIDYSSSRGSTWSSGTASGSSFNTANDAAAVAKSFPLLSGFALPAVPFSSSR